MIAGTSYTFGVWIKMDNVVATLGCQSYVYWKDSSGITISNLQVKNYSTGTIPWTYYERTATATAGAVNISWRVLWCRDRDGTSGSGTAYVDDVSMNAD